MRGNLIYIYAQKRSRRLWSYLWRETVGDVFLLIEVTLEDAR